MGLPRQRVDHDDHGTTDLGGNSLSLEILYAAHVMLDKPPLRDVPAGALAFAGFAFLVGVIGVGGQLHHIVLFNKWPKT